MTNFLQFALIGIGLGSAYALFAQGIVLIYRGSGIVNFAHGSLGMVTAYVTFLTGVRDRKWPIGVAAIVGIAAAIAVSLLFQTIVLKRLKAAAPITRLIATLGLLVVLQSAIELKYGKSNQAVEAFLPHDTWTWGDVRVQEQTLYVAGVAVAITALLWAFVRFTRVGLAVTATAQNERAVQTLGWSPNALSTLTWGVGAGLAGIAGVLVGPLTGLSPTTFTLVVTIAAMAAALVGGFQSFPMTLLGGMVVGIGESLMTLYKGDIEKLVNVDGLTGLNRAVPFVLILIVLVIRGRGLPLRSHITDRLPRLGTGVINVRAILVAAAILLVLLFTVLDDRWAAATYISLSSSVLVLSIIVLTGYAGQLSLAQWALAGTGAMIAGSFVLRLGWPMEVAAPLGVLLTIPAGVLFALPALRTRGVNLAVVTLGLGFTVQQVVFLNNKFVSEGIDTGTRIGEAEVFGYNVSGTIHPHRWAVVCLVAFVATALVVANLRRSRTGRRLIAVRTNERAAASLGISVFGVKLYAFGVAAAIAGLGGILIGFSAPLITYEQFNPLQSIFSVGWAVIGGVGYVVGAAFAAPNAIGGLGTKIAEDLLSLDRWDTLIGGAVLLLMILKNQNGIADVAVRESRKLFLKLRLMKPDPEPTELPAATAIESVAPVSLRIEDLTVRFGGVVAVDSVSFSVEPGEVVGLIGPNGAGKTTIIDAVTAFVKPAAGTLHLNDARIDGWSASKRARHGLRRSFQSLELFEDISIEDNIRAGSESGTWWTWVTDLFWPRRHALTSAAVGAIREFQLEDHLAEKPEELPYGRRRLVGIARSVASAPSVIMLDEPAAGLDENESRELARLIRRLADDRRMGVLLVEHDVGLVMSTCDRIVVIDFGRVIASGTPSEIRANPLVKAAYLGASEDEDVEMPELTVGVDA